MRAWASCALLSCDMVWVSPWWLTLLPPLLAAFIDIKNQCVGSQCAKGQWAVSIALGDVNKPNLWTPLYPGNATNPLGSCPTPKYGACFYDGSPLGPPITVMGTSQMQVTYTFKANLNFMVLFNRTSMKPRTLQFKVSHAATHIERMQSSRGSVHAAAVLHGTRQCRQHAARLPCTLSSQLCYSDAAFADRAWRKKNKPYPRVSCKSASPLPFEMQCRRHLRPLPLALVQQTHLQQTCLQPLRFYQQWTCVLNSASLCTWTPLDARS